MDMESTEKVDIEGRSGAAPAAPEWLTREAAAIAVGKSVRTLDRLRDAGVIADVPGPGPIKVSVASLEAYLRHKITTKAPDAVTTIPVPIERYEGLMVQLANKTRQLEEISAKQLTWQRSEAEREAERIAAAEALAEAERRGKAALAAERITTAEALAEAEARAAAEIERERRGAAEAVAKAEAEREALRIEAQDFIDKKNAAMQALEAELQAERARGFWSRLLRGAK